MAITKQKKEEIVRKISDIAKSAKTIVFVNFKKLSVNDQTQMRRALRAQNIGYTVAKKSLIKRALEASKFDGSYPALEGEVSLTYGEEELSPARELAVFVKKFPDQLAFAGGIFGGKFVNKEEITAIAAIPGVDALRAQFVQLINSPLQRFAVLINAKADK